MYHLQQSLPGPTCCIYIAGGVRRRFTTVVGTFSVSARTRAHRHAQLLGVPTAWQGQLAANQARGKHHPPPPGSSGAPARGNSGLATGGGGGLGLGVLLVVSAALGPWSRPPLGWRGAASQGNGMRSVVFDAASRHLAFLLCHIRREAHGPRCLRCCLWSLLRREEFWLFFFFYCKSS
jgi:hypothetical protein